MHISKLPTPKLQHKWRNLTIILNIKSLGRAKYGRPIVYEDLVRYRCVPKNAGFAVGLIVFRLI
jgi:hypothetical protein